MGSWRPMEFMLAIGSHPGLRRKGVGIYGWHFTRKMSFFRRWLLARWVAGRPQHRPWIGTPSRPHLPSPIVVWPSLSQTHSYSTHNTTSYNSGARPDIWKNDTYSGPVNKNGYSRGPEIFIAMEAAKNKDAAAKKNSGTDSLTKNRFKAIAYSW
jgi:hypothetical protein